MIRIAVVEDDPQCAKQLEQYILDFERETGRSFSVTTYSDGAQLVEGYKAQFDIILMDVVLPLLDGMAAAACIRKVDQEVIILFITNMAQYAIRGYEVDALDYILKPVSYFSFSQRLGRALSRIRDREKVWITIPVKGGVVKVEVRDLLYVESQRHQIIYHTRVEEYVSSGTLRQVEESLENHGFFRCNKGCMVNLEHVDGIQDGCVLINGSRLTISRPRRSAFLSALTDFVGGVRQ